MNENNFEWQRQIQEILDEIDECIKRRGSEALTLSLLSQRLGYSEYYFTRKFREISGMRFRDYLRRRKMAFALKEVRDTARGLLDIALDYGFSSHEAFTRAFHTLYGVSPGEYRKMPRPVILRTKICSFDRYFLGLGEIGMIKSTEEIKIYFATIPAHKFLHVRNYESNGYWDFWQRQSRIPGQDCETVCGLLDSIGGKLDDDGGSESNSGSGQVMAYINDPAGRLCAWGTPRAECYGARLPSNYGGKIPPQMLITDIPEAEYLVFEHGPFRYEQENRSVEEQLEKAMSDFDYAGNGCRIDTAPGRIAYLYHDPERYFKIVRPIERL